MKLKLFTLLTSCIIALNSFGQATFHDFTVVTIMGDTISLSQFYGKKVMVVNTATLCAYTHQYTDLEVLYTNYNQYNFEIVGFPCNNFGNQEPGNDSTINDFCHNNYDVTFPMMSKVDIVTGDTADVYKWLQRADLNGVQTAHVSWNFNKFLIDEAGHWARHYDSPVSPTDTAITNWIMSPSVIQTGIAEVGASPVYIYPNPTIGDGIVTLQGIANVAAIQVINVVGQQVFYALVNTDKMQLDLSAQPKGVYVYRLIGKSGVIKTGKIINQ